jgi:hypothetical protein
MLNFFRHRRSYLHYVGLAALLLVIAQVALVVLMTLAWVSLPLARTLSTLVWLGAAAWAVFSYARGQLRSPEAAATPEAPARLIPQQEHLTRTSG